MALNLSSGPDILQLNSCNFQSDSVAITQDFLRTIRPESNSDVSTVCQVPIMQNEEVAGDSDGDFDGETQGPYSDIDDLFKCSVCIFRFSLTEPNLKPVMLSCHHTVCNGCSIRLKRHARSTDVIQCPSCRDVTIFKPRNQTLPPNFYVIRLLESKERREAEYTRNTLSFWCKDCKQVATPYCVNHSIETLPQTVESLYKADSYLSSTLNEIISDKLMSSTNKFNKSKDSDLALMEAITELKSYIMGVHQKFEGVTVVKRKYMSCIEEMHGELQGLSASMKDIKDREESPQPQHKLIINIKDIQKNISKMQSIENSLSSSRRLTDEIHTKLMTFKTLKSHAYQDRLRVLIKTLEGAFKKCFEEVVEIDQNDEGASTSESFDSKYKNKRSSSSADRGRGKKKIKVVDLDDSDV